MPDEVKILGAFEKVSFPDLGLFDVVAKIDTGALSGAVHATDIKEVMLPTGEKAVSFLPFGKEPAILSTGYKVKVVRSSNGAISTRHIISTTITVEDVQYPINISIADRNGMMKGVLIGRQFLRRHGFVVDARKGTQYRYDVK